MKRFLAITASLVWVGLVVAGALTLRLYSYWNSPTIPGEPAFVVEIASGLNVKETARELARRGLVHDPLLFSLGARLLGKDRGVRAGEYYLSPGMSPHEILTAITSGPPLAHKVTIPEGLTIREIADRLEEEGFGPARRFIAAANDPVLAASLGVPAASLEGYLFPDTYYLPKGVSPRTIVAKMNARFKEVWDDLEKSVTRSKDTAKMSRHQIVTLASLVEAEIRDPAERELVAGVFVNRLRRGMLLQCDPTVRYGFPQLKKRLRTMHLKSPHPYNTYIHRGLPPGPIGAPGADSLKAALSPAQTKYLYFVSRNDGTHQFSENYRQHRRAVAKYQR